jgi:predicted DNA-binding protein
MSNMTYSLNVSLPKAMLEKIENQAEKERRTKCQIVRIAIEDYFRKKNDVIRLVR